MKKSIQKSVSLFLILLLVLVPSKSLFSTTDQAKETAAAMMIVLVGLYDCQMRDNYNHGSLEPGEYEVITTTLLSGLNYYFAAGGCDYAYDVDIAVYDANWNLIVRDNSTTKSAWVSIEVYRSGVFHIQVTMHDCTYSGAHWALVCGFK
jgi:hypothetical protein